MIRSISIISIALVVICAMPFNGAARRTHAERAASRLPVRRAPTPVPAPSDSITILLFAGFDLTHITLTSASGWMLDGSPAGERKTIEIEISDTLLRVNGGAMRRCTLASRDGKPVEIGIPGHTKLMRGKLACTRDAGELRLTARMPMRDYLAATLSTEASPTDPMEYLVALSVLQRNYVAGHENRHGTLADLCDNTHCQRADARQVSSRIYAAVDRAAHITLEAGGGYPCYYSVNCGGSTLTPAQIWRRPEPGYTNVSCTYCRNSARYRWERAVQATPAAERMLGMAPARPFVDDDFKIRLGRVIGFNKVLSNTIDRIERRGPTYLIAGRGFGHRVGLCQEGAVQLALRGWKADDILRFYFPAANVSLQR